jgi:hypothetical protein
LLIGAKQRALQNPALKDLAFADRWMGFGLHGSQFTKTGDPLIASFWALFPGGPSFLKNINNLKNLNEKIQPTK